VSSLGFPKRIGFIHIWDGEATEADRDFYRDHAIESWKRATE
jgi:hypothetical protein